MQLPEVVARVNGESISRTEFQNALKTIEERAGGPVPPEQRDRIYRGVLDQMVGIRLLAQEANSRKIPVADADVDERIDTIRKQFPSEEAFTTRLKQQNVTLDRVRTDTRQELAINKMLEMEIEPKVAATPDAIAAFYKGNPQSFQVPERVKASHILVSVPQGADAATKEKAREKAQGLLKDVKAGKDFAAIARESSDDPGSAKNGGDLGFFQQGQMVGPFNDVAFTLKPGDTSDLVETDFGFHIIRVAEKQTGRTVPIDEARPKIEEFLKNQNRQRETASFVNALRSKGKVEILI